VSLRRLLASPLYRIYEERLSLHLDPRLLPHHVGVILDGNRRYARAEGLGSHGAGHRAGMDKLLQFLGWSAHLDIPAVTVWLLSTENLSRDTEELAAYYDILVDLFRHQLPDRARELDMAIKVIGSIDLLPEPLVAAAKELADVNPGGRRRLTLALAYGGRQEIVDAVRDLVADLADDGVASAELPRRISADAIAANLYTADLPDPDLVIRTSGESRLSGFLLWQSAYAEYSFIDVFWPAFRRVDFLRALRDFTRRERRFGR
jgi:short-chain Z-isoprenyl diphosphate synthase